MFDLFLLVCKKTFRQLDYSTSYRYKLDSVGPVRQNQQQIRLNIHTCTSQWCYYIHD